MAAFFEKMLKGRMGEYIFAGLIDGSVCSGFLIHVDPEVFVVKRFDPANGEFRDILAVKLSMAKYFALDGMDFQRERFEIETKIADAEKENCPFDTNLFSPQVRLKPEKGKRASHAKK